MFFVFFFFGGGNYEILGRKMKKDLNIFQAFYLFDVVFFCLGGVTFGTNKSSSRWWFQTFFEFSPLLGEMIQFDERAYFSNGLVKNHQLVMIPDTQWDWYICLDLTL